MAHIKLKNKTGSDIPLNDLDVPNAVIPANGTVTVSDTNETIAIVQDEQLHTLIHNGDVVIVFNDNELTQNQSELFVELKIAEFANTSIENGAIDTGNCFASKREKYIYFKGSSFTASSISIADAGGIISATGHVKTSGGTQEIVGFNDGTNTAQIYLDTATNTIKSRASGSFLNQEYKIKIVYITT